MACARQTIVAGLMCLMIPVAMAADAERGEPRYWLQRMVNAMHELNYDGTFIYEHRGRMQTVRIIHNAGPAGERERLVALSGPPREVIRDSKSVTCFLPDDNAVMVEESRPSGPFPIAVPEKLDRLRTFYRFTLRDSDRIADHRVRHIAIEPKDRFRYGHNLWVEEETGLLLKAELINEQGLVVEQFLFTSIRFSDDPFPESLLQPKGGGEDMIRYQRPAVVADDSEDAEQSAWRVASLPPGFERDIYRRHYMPSIEAPVEHFVFTDGLASISVFIERHDGKDKGIVGPSKVGAVNAYVRDAGDYLVTVVGEVPKAAVRQVAEAVERRQ